jgi:GxxExxY protein
MRRLEFDLTERILSSALAVHREPGPGLLESTYRTCLQHQFRLDGLKAEAECPIGFDYKGLAIDCAYRADLVVEARVLVELKAVEHLLPVHEAQLLTDLRFSGLRVGLLLNFHVRALRNGLRRLVR